MKQGNEKLIGIGIYWLLMVLQLWLFCEGVSDILNQKNSALQVMSAAIPLFLFIHLYIIRPKL